MATSYDVVKIGCAKSWSNDAFGCQAQIRDVYLGGDPEISCLGWLLSAQAEVEVEKGEKDRL